MCPILIHNRQYVTVAERVTEAHKDLDKISITTEVLSQNPVVIKATVTTKKGIFTGISAANPAKSIEKQSPYEVAETSAVGRALGFAGYGAVDSIASADEIHKSQQTDEGDSIDPITQEQIKRLLKEAGKPEPKADWLKGLSQTQGDQLIAKLSPPSLTEQYKQIIKE